MGELLYRAELRSDVPAGTRWWRPAMTSLGESGPCCRAVCHRPTQSVVKGRGGHLGVSDRGAVEGPNRGEAVGMVPPQRAFIHISVGIVDKARWAIFEEFFSQELLVRRLRS